jgi:copper resistance protein C
MEKEVTDSFFSIHFLYRRRISLKKIILALFSCVFIFSAAGNTFAHTHLTSTNPADGETITEPLTEITLTFEGQIEQGSTLELTDADNEAVELKGISVADGVITGTLENPLDNGSYLVKWSSISADGHPLEGEFTFAVESSAAEETAEESGTSEDEAAPLAEENNEEKAEKSSFTMIMVGIVVVMVLLMAVSFFFLMRRKK